MTSQIRVWKIMLKISSLILHCELVSIKVVFPEQAQCNPISPFLSLMPSPLRIAWYYCRQLNRILSKQNTSECKVMKQWLNGNNASADRKKCHHTICIHRVEEINCITDRFLFFFWRQGKHTSIKRFITFWANRSIFIFIY